MKSIKSYLQYVAINGIYAYGIYLTYWIGDENIGNVVTAATVLLGIASVLMFSGYRVLKNGDDSDKAKAVKIAKEYLEGPRVPKLIDKTFDILVATVFAYFGDVTLFVAYVIHVVFQTCYIEELKDTVAGDD